MARVLLGQVYGIVNFHGARRGKVMVGGYLPPRAGQWRSIHVLNLPVFALHPCAPLLHQRDGALFGLAAAGAAWALASLAANAPVPGKLVQWHNGRIAPLRDEQIAALLNLTPAEWQRVAAALLGGSGVGALELTACEIDVPDAEAPLYRIDPQMRLPLADDLLFFCAPGNGVAPFAPQRNVNGNENVTQRNAMGSPPRTGGPPHPAAVGVPEEAGGDGVAARSVLPVFSNQQAVQGCAGQAAADALRDEALHWRERYGGAFGAAAETLLKHVQGERPDGALLAWIDCCRLALRPAGGDTGYDRKEWGRAFAALCRRPARDGTPATPELRRRRCADAAATLRAIAEDVACRSPAKVFSAWLGKHGLRPKKQE